MQQPRYSPAPPIRPPPPMARPPAFANVSSALLKYITLYKYIIQKYRETLASERSYSILNRSDRVLRFVVLMLKEI